ncbi:MAG: UV DNA damage repair endonuclease UvsE [Chitinispirillaceae bacterium]
MPPRIGYPCINRSLDCSSSRTFRLASYSEERLIQTVSGNLDCLQRILEFNTEHNLLFFRITSDLVPFASHPVCTYNWQDHFSEKFRSIGQYIRKHGMRISMHPDQFVLLNAKENRIVESSIRELQYHAEVLDLLGLDQTARIQIHLGGAYGNKEESMKRFVSCYLSLEKPIKNRLVIENDDRIYNLSDCLEVNGKTAIPILFDTFHYECNNTGESLKNALDLSSKTWKKKDGPLMLDYSSQNPNGRRGSHIEHINARHFRSFLEVLGNTSADIMLEIKDKEKSACRAERMLKQHQI